jgi:hypothetical protein
MPFSDYGSLQATIGKDWLNRSDLTVQIPDFIALAEATMKRRLRRTSVRVQIPLTLLAGTIDTIVPPADMVELRSIRLVTGQPDLDRPLTLVSPEVLAEASARQAYAVGRPRWVSIIGGNIVVAQPPDQLYTAEIIYFQSLVPLSGTNTTNIVLTAAPDAYLFGALLQAAPYLEHDERIPVWQAKFDAAIDELNDNRDREEYNASVRQGRLPMVFG